MTFASNALAPKHANRMIVRQNEVFDRLIRMLSQLFQPVACRSGRRAGFDRNYEIVTFDGAHIGITFGGQGEHTIRENLERFGFLCKVL
ncbi:hypothetical protein O4G73_03060 [Erythrobacter sp. G21629-S1]|nr:hypothetical protein [Erythrobacter sp. G21629-S1]